MTNKIEKDNRIVLELKESKNQDGTPILVLVSTQYNQYHFNDRATVELNYADVSNLFFALQEWLLKVE